MQKIKTNLTQVTNFLNTNTNSLINVYDLNKNKLIKTTNIINNNNFKLENTVQFDNNVIIKKNSQFLPKLKSYVKTYQIEKFKHYYWPTFTNENTKPAATTQVNINLSQLDNLQLDFIKNTPLLITAGGEKKKINYPQKVEISKLNRNKKGSLINNKAIENLNSNTLTSSLLNNNFIKEGLALANKDTQENRQKINKNTILSQYMNTISINNSKINTGPNLFKKYGTLFQYNKIISYSFLQNKQTVLIKNNNNLYKEEIEKIMNSEYIENTYKLLFIFFKSIYCLISKPVISITPDKVNIQLFYYLNIPKKKIIKLFAIHYFNSFKNKWLNNSPLVLQSLEGPLENRDSKGDIAKNLSQKNKMKMPSFSKKQTQVKKRLPFINRKARKSISRLKSKSSYLKNTIFNLIKYNIAKVFSYKFKLICDLLSSKFNKPVELELIRLHNPYLDTNILANLLHLIIKNKKKKPKIAIDKIYNKNQVKKLNDPNLISVNNKPAFLSGLNFYINGRTMGEAIVPRMTTKSFEKGATATGKINFLDKSSITKKNKKGAYTIKVISAQNFF